MIGHGSLVPETFRSYTVIELPEQSVHTPDTLANERRIANRHAHSGVGSIVPSLMIVPVVGERLVLENLAHRCAEKFLFDHGPVDCGKTGSIRDEIVGAGQFDDIVSLIKLLREPPATHGGFDAGPAPTVMPGPGRIEPGQFEQGSPHRYRELTITGQAVRDREVETLLIELIVEDEPVRRDRPLVGIDRTTARTDMPGRRLRTQPRTVFWAGIIKIPLRLLLGHNQRRPQQYRRAVDGVGVHRCQVGQARPGREADFRGDGQIAQGNQKPGQFRAPLTDGCVAAEAGNKKGMFIPRQCHQLAPVTGGDH